MSKKVYFKVEGEWFTDFFRNMYYAEDMSFEDCKEKLIKSLDLQDIIESQKNSITEQILFGGKKFTGVNDFDLVEDTEFDAYNYSRFPRPVFKGLSKYAIGILLADGIFVQCKYKQHADTLDSISNDRLANALTFYTDSFYHEFRVSKDIITIPISEYQKRWIKNNSDYLSDDQKQDLRVMLGIESSKDKEFIDYLRGE